MEKTNAKLLFFGLVGLVLVLDIAGQERVIDREQYFAAYGSTNSKTEGSYPRKETVLNERFENNKRIFLKTDIYEYAARDSLTHAVEVIEKGKKSTSKYIRIGNAYYCQDGPNPFKKSKTPCEPVNMEMSPDPDTQKFSVSRITTGNEVLMVYRMYTLRSFAPNSRDKPKVFSFEQIFSVRPDGRFAGFDIRNGIDTEPGEISSKTTIRYEYDVTIPKIEAPKV